ncbi:ROK family protein [Pedococcus ginsenosidimutans]|uniref:ROK family protein n=1 Tax=Pedococcus ginsenosidimutans TaxID=490570 RepID=A0ABP8Y9Z1_9MICO
MTTTVRSSPALLDGEGTDQVFQLLRDAQPRTRAQVASHLGLSRATVAMRIDRLMELGLIGPVEGAASSGGRPPSQFAFNPTARLALATDLGASHAAVALTDLTGSIVARKRVGMAIADGPERVLGWMVEAAQSLLDEVRRDAGDLVAVGIGLPGPVEFSTGRPINPPIMPGWDRFDVPGWVRQHLEVPVLVDNDVNIMALGEQSHSWPGVEHFMLVKVATGIGSGIISGGRLQRGAQGIAGDLGHVQIARGADVPCHCGNYGCLEAMASGPAIAASLARAGVPATTSADVIELVKAGDLVAIQAVRQAGRDIGEVLATCVSLINPAVVAIGGSIAAVGEHLLAGVREIVYSRSMPLATEHLQIVQARAGADAGLIGAGMLAIDHALGRRQTSPAT